MALRHTKIFFIVAKYKGKGSKKMAVFLKGNRSAMAGQSFFI